MTNALPPLPGAKIQLLEWLKGCGSWEALLLSDDLLEARTLQELAERAHGIVLQLQDVNEGILAGSFWEAAKDIITRCRTLAGTPRPS